MAQAPEANPSTLTAALVHSQGETGTVRPLAGGVGEVRLIPASDRVTVELQFDPGWHANAHSPASENLIGTHLIGETLGAIRYPQAVSVPVSFQSEPIMALAGTARIEAERRPGPGAVELTVQVCGTDRCLPPETHAFRLPEG